MGSLVCVQGPAAVVLLWLRRKVTCKHKHVESCGMGGDTSVPQTSLAAKGLLHTGAIPLLTLGEVHQILKREESEKVTEPSASVFQVHI